MHDGGAWRAGRAAHVQERGWPGATRQHHRGRLAALWGRRCRLRSSSVRLAGYLSEGAHCQQTHRARRRTPRQNTPGGSLLGIVTQGALTCGCAVRLARPATRLTTALITDSAATTFNADPPAVFGSASGLLLLPVHREEGQPEGGAHEGCDGNTPLQLLVLYIPRLRAARFSSVRGGVKYRIAQHCASASQ